MTRKAKFYLYRNLRTGGFSVKQHGLVYDRGDLFTMNHVEFRVSDPGSKRAKDSQQRNVHAYMVAEDYSKPMAEKFRPEIFIRKMTHVTYHPFKDNTFVIADTNEPILKADYAIAYKGRVYIP